MARCRIMQITHDLAIGGLQQVVVNICNTIDREKFDISVLCLRNLGPFAQDVKNMGIKVYSLPQDGARVDYFGFLKIAKILMDNGIEVIHTHNTQPFLDGTIAALISGVKTIVHTDHARDFPDKKRYMFAEWLMSHFAYRIVCVSAHTALNLTKYEKISTKKIVIISNGIDEKKYNITINKERKKRELGLIEKNPIIGLGVRLTEQKGITYLLQAMPEVIQCFPNIALVIAGEGPLESELRMETDVLGVEKNVSFIGPRLDMPELLKMFDLYVLPSLWEGLPMVLLEAMAAGCPIVATNVGGNKTAIEHGRNGSLIRPKEPSDLSAEIKKVLYDENLRFKYVRESREILQKKFSAHIMTKKYEKLYLRRN